MMDVKVLKDKNIIRWVDRENLIYYQVGQLLTAVWLWTSHILLKKKHYLHKNYEPYTYLYELFINTDEQGL